MTDFPQFEYSKEENRYVAMHHPFTAPRDEDVDKLVSCLLYTSKYADKLGAAYSLVLGDDELEQGKAELKNMKTGEKKKISLGDRFLDDYLTAVTEQEDLSF